MFSNDYQEDQCKYNISGDCRKSCPLVISRDGKCVKDYSYDKKKKKWVKDFDDP